MMNHKVLLAVLLIAGGALFPTFFGEFVMDKETIRSSDGIIFEVDFQDKSNRVNVSGYNPNERSVLTSLVVQVDGADVLNKENTLRANQWWNFSSWIYAGMDVEEKRHTVVVSTFGSYVQFNFTRSINTSNPGPVPTPQIRDVHIKNGTIDGEPSTVAEVTVANPSKQTYPTKLMVHTTGTDGSFYGAPVPPGETRTITVELLEERGTTVAGEARLYTEGLNKREGAMDQVEFVGRAGADTRHWNTSYEPVRPPWVEDSYRYRNSSVTGDGGLLPGEAGSWWVYAVAGVVLLVWLVRKVR